MYKKIIVASAFVLSFFFVGKVFADTATTSGSFNLTSSSISRATLRQGESAVIKATVQNSGTTTSGISEITLFDQSNKQRDTILSRTDTWSENGSVSYEVTTPTTLSPNHYRAQLSIYTSDHMHTLATFGSVASFEVVAGTTSEPHFVLGGDVPSTSVRTGEPVTFHASFQNTGGSVSQGVADIEVYSNSNEKVFQKFFVNQDFSTNVWHDYTLTWTPNAEGKFTVKLGAFSNNWATNYAWNGNAGEITARTSSGGGSVGGSNSVSIWWPGSDVQLSGTQPFKALLENTDINSYILYWQVDGGQLNQMYTSNADYPHKEALVDLSGWHWRSDGRYLITFVAQKGESVIAEKSVYIRL